MLAGMHGHVNTMIIKKRVFDQVGLFDTKLERHEDLDMWLRIANQYPRIGYVAASQANYYVDRAGSISGDQWPVQQYVLFTRQQLRYADESHSRDKFNPLARKLLRGWLRNFLFSGRGDDVRILLKEFGFIFPAYYRYAIGVLAINAKITSSIMKGISKVKRTFFKNQSIKR